MKRNIRVNKPNSKKNKIGAAVAIGISSGVALAALSIVVLTAVYCKSLLNVQYFAENDVYDE